MDKAAQTSENAVEETTVDTSRKKQILLTVVKSLISAFLIYLILRGTNFKEIFAAMKKANFPLLLLSFTLHFVGFFVSALRWRTLLKVHQVESNLWYLIKSYIVAMFFNNFLPSTVGGDTVRAYDSYRLGKSKSGAVAVVFVDRFLGLTALILYAFIAAFFAKNITQRVPYLNLWVSMAAFGMLFIIWLIFMPSRKLADWVGKIRIPFSAKLQRLLMKLIDAFWAFRGQRTALLKALGLSLVLQANVVFYYFLISSALGFHIPLYNFFLIVPLSIFIMMIPVSINGIGLRENVFFFFLGTFAVARPEAIAFAWIEYGILMLQGVLGGVVYALRR